MVTAWALGWQRDARIGVALVFFAGCAVGGASARFVVPLASAQQATPLTKWAFVCTDTPSRGIPEFASATFGANGWEAFYIAPPGIAGKWCFKRPKR